MQPDALWKRVQMSFERHGMMLRLEARLLRVEPGMVEIALPFSDKVSQHDGKQSPVAVMQQTLLPAPKTY